MVKRSYTKQTELKSKDFLPGAMVGKEFTTNTQEDVNSLSQIGKQIIQKFKNDNERNVKTLREKEEEIYKFKHSKPGVQLNNWKPFNHIIEEFSRPPGDKIHSYRQERKKKFLVENPFRRPKINGDYFEKYVKLI